MCSIGRLLVLVLLLTFGPASAQETKGWLGADVIDVTKAEADRLGWDTPHGAKLGVVAFGSPAEQAGLRTDDIIVSIDNVEPETRPNSRRPSQQSLPEPKYACASTRVAESGA